LEFTGFANWQECMDANEKPGCDAGLIASIGSI
jgi:hypothetical protein